MERSLRKYPLQECCEQLVAGQLSEQNAVNLAERYSAQTDGAEYQPPAIPQWDRAHALATLNIEEIPFEMLNGNCQGYAKGRQIAINPVAQHVAKTTFHELAHIELGHTTEAVHDSESLPRNLKEVEAECVALLCLESLGMDGAEFCRGYIQSWLAGAEIPERSTAHLCSRRQDSQGWHRPQRRCRMTFIRLFLVHARDAQAQ